MVLLKGTASQGSPVEAKNEECKETTTEIQHVNVTAKLTSNPWVIKLEGMSTSIDATFKTCSAAATVARWFAVICANLAVLSFLH
ncbi:unnamed protein product [Dibothriocephalus latus]|uniref:Uncharacterized protein n=1 Tax=Dibothriocephalus latus TaxID=60516 RepID=A0A3P7PBX3_DIBLA|nr:unnamed protein product [Dibothriocephalus latus]